jgi:hypothetical protein
MFFGAAWFLGCFYHLGDLGRYSDDWAFADVDPVTHLARWGGTPFERHYFWRPALQAFLHYAFLILWHHMWIFHLMNVACHAAIAAGVYWLSRRLGSSPHASAAAAFVFLLFPFQYEVIFWSTAMTSAVPAGLMIVLCGIVIFHARSTGADWRRLGLMSVLMFFAACWYEQPCAIAAGFPFLYMASRQEEPLARSLRRIAAMMIACGVPLVAYILLLRYTAPASARGGAGSFVTLDELPKRLESLVPAFSWYFSARLRNAYLGGLTTGMRELVTIRGAIMAATVGILGGCWLVEWISRPVPPIPTLTAERARARARAAWGFAFALAACLSVWLPIIPIRNQILEVRLAYCMCIGLALAIAFLLDFLGRLTRKLRVFPLLHTAVGGAVVVLVWVSSVAMLGWQSVIRTRTAIDAVQTRELAERFASVPPGTVFLLLRDDYRAGATGRLAFDWPPLGWTSASWSSTPAIRWAMKRNDVVASAINIWVPPPFRDPDDAGIVYTGGLTPIASVKSDPKGHLLIRWDLMVPYYIDAQGRVNPVREVHVFSTSTPKVVVGRATLVGADAKERFNLELP